MLKIQQKETADGARAVYFTFSVLALGLAGEGLGLFLTSIQDSESRSGRLAERPLGIVLRFEVSDSVLVFCFAGLEVVGEPVEDKTIDRR